MDDRWGCDACPSLTRHLREMERQVDRWREHAEADCGALRRVWRSLAQLDDMAGLLRRERPNGAASRVVADAVEAATKDVRAAVLGQRGTWTAVLDREPPPGADGPPLSGPGFPAGWPGQVT